MRVWTDGTTHLVVRARGVEIHRAGQPAALRELEGVVVVGGSPLRHVLAVTSRDPLRAWVGHGAGVRRVELGDEAEVGSALPAYVLDAVGLADGRVLACVAPARASAEGVAPRAKLVLVPGDSAELEGAEEIAVPAPTRIKWPGGIWFDEAIPWPEDEAAEDEVEPPPLDALAVAYPQRDGRATYDHVVMISNEHGVAVAGTFTGLVVALAPGGGRAEFAVRVPTQAGETEIHAARTPAGVVVVICVEGRESAVLHIAPDGKVLAHRDKIGKEPAWGMGLPVVQGERVLVYEAGQGAGERLHELSLSDLKVVKSVDGAGKSRGELSVASAPGGSPVVLGLGEAACLLERGGRGRILLRTLEPPAPPAPPPRPPAKPERAVGTPSLALAGPGGPRVWTVATGSVLPLEIPFTNHGGIGKGVAIEIGGPAFAAGLVQVQRAVVGELTAPVVARGGAARVELPGVPLLAGLTDRGPKNAPLPDPAAQMLRVELVGAKAGTAVLTVRITPLGVPPGRGSVLQGKSLTVTG